MQLVDIGLNLTHDSFDSDRSAVVARARLAGVAHFILTGTTVTGSESALKMARQDPGMTATAGVHPHHADELDETGLERLRELLAAEETVAVGECGLDFFRNFSPREDQERAFALQLELARETGKPLFLHQRDAHARMMEMLRAHDGGRVDGVVHCFTDGPAEAEDILATEAYLGITGWVCDERRGDALRQAVKIIPDNRLLVETDAPYLLPRDLPREERVSKGSRRNEPAYLPHIVERIAALRNQSPDEVAALSTANAQRLFRLPELVRART
ncbi:MAG: TatD family hydrolase [Gammaproteobacteria bacterium]|nr:TatD family hydrolase [Gammaproteobacteria bacterium]